MLCLLYLFHLDIAAGQSLSWVSWFHRGISQSNNSVLRFNIYDTLNLACRAYGSNARGRFVFVISKGHVPTTAKSDNGWTVINGPFSNWDQIICSDTEDITPGYENFVVIGTNHMTNSVSNSKFAYDTRYVNVGRLTYCSNYQLNHASRSDLNM